jgi:hypothetical protein
MFLVMILVQIRNMAQVARAIVVREAPRLACEGASYLVMKSWMQLPSLNTAQKRELHGSETAAHEIMVPSAEPWQDPLFSRILFGVMSLCDVSAVRLGVRAAPDALTVQQG